MDIKTEVLKILRHTDGFVSGQNLCETLGVSRTAVWKCVNQLKEEGYEFDAVSNKGYRIVKYPDIITKAEIESELNFLSEPKASLENSCSGEHSESRTSLHGILSEPKASLENSCSGEHSESRTSLHGILSEPKASLENSCSGNPAVLKIVYYDETDSTNTRAKLAAEEGEPSGTLFVAESQTGGKGRRGRSWVSPSGSGIWMSLLLRPQIKPYDASMLTIVAALALTKAIEECVHGNDKVAEAQPPEREFSKLAFGSQRIPSNDVLLSLRSPEREFSKLAFGSLRKFSTGSECRIKWPNDIVIGNRKICGILTEMSAELEQINYVVIGIGINVNTTEFDDSIKDMASSIFLETGVHVKRSNVIAAFASHFSAFYGEFLEKCDLSGVVDDYNKYLINAGREVRIIERDGEYTATAVGIDETGELIVKLPTGETKKIVSGEVSVRGLYGYV